MNILFLTKELPFPLNRGDKIRTFNLLKGLSRKNRVTLVSFADLKEDKNKIDILKEYCTSIETVSQKRRGLNRQSYFSVFLSLFSSLPFGIKKRYSQEMKDKIEHILKQNKIGLIFCDSLYQSIHISFKDKHYKILSEHNIESVIIYRYFKSEKNLVKKAYALIEYIKMKGFENRAWQKFNYSLVCSKRDKEVIKRRVPNLNVDTVPNGVDTLYFRPNTAEEVRPFSLIYTGQMDWYPNEDAVTYFLKEIYPLIKKQASQVSFCIVGSNPSGRIRKMARQDKSIIITGFVDDIRPYIAQASIFVVPLRIGSGTRLKILEAMAVGKPVVSTSIGCEGLEVVDGENIIIANKSQDFANAVVNLSKDMLLREKLGNAAKRLVEEKYSWDNIREQLNEVLKEIAECPSL